MVTVTKTAVAAIAFSAVHALPQATWTTVATPSGATPSAAAPTPDAEQVATSSHHSSSAPSFVARLKSLLGMEDGILPTFDELKEHIVFDFNRVTPDLGTTAGSFKAANIQTFPILAGQGIATTLMFLDACAINTPYVHARATEMLTVVKGTLDFGFIPEVGLLGEVAEIAGSLETFQGTVFPQGSIHYQVNNACEPAVFVLGLNSEDPGTFQVAPALLGLNVGVLNATLGGGIDGKNSAQFREAIPENVARSVDSCRARCNAQGTPRPRARELLGCYS